jgi:hypothetical protein
MAEVFPAAKKQQTATLTKPRFYGDRVPWYNISLRRSAIGRSRGLGWNRHDSRLWVVLVDIEGRESRRRSRHGME